MRWIVMGLLAGPLVGSLSGCDDCETVDLLMCSIEAPTTAAPRTPIHLDLTYETTGCVTVEETTHTMSGGEIELAGKGRYCCKSCMCALWEAPATYELPGLAPGTYRLVAARAGGQIRNCGGSRVSRDLVVR